MACRRCGNVKSSHRNVAGIGLVCPVAAFTYEEGDAPETRRDGPIAPGTSDGEMRYDGAPRLLR